MKMKDVFELPLSIKLDHIDDEYDAIDALLQNDGSVVTDKVMHISREAMAAASLAINSHDALVEALELIVNNNAENVKQGYGGFLDKAELIKAQAALNAAKGE